jgi:hypothetical protein
MKIVKFKNGKYAVQKTSNSLFPKEKRFHDLVNHTKYTYSLSNGSSFKDRCLVDTYQEAQNYIDERTIVESFEIQTYSQAFRVALISIVTLVIMLLCIGTCSAQGLQFNNDEELKATMIVDPTFTDGGFQFGGGIVLTIKLN